MPVTPTLSAKVTALLADEVAWQGHRATLVLRLEPGRGSVTPELPVGAAARASVELAVRVGLGAEAQRWSARWTLELPPELPVQLVEGDSLGLAAAVAARAALEGRTVPAELALCARVRSDGDLEAVGGVAIKAAAAVEAGIAALVVAPGTAVFSAPDRVEQGSLESLVGWLWPQPRRRGLRLALGALAAALGGLCGPAVLETGWLAPLDQNLQQRVLDLGWLALPADQTLVVLMPAVEQGGEPEINAASAWFQRRERLAPLIRGLAAARALSITLDRVLIPEDPADSEIAAAIREVVADGVPVNLALGELPAGALPASPALRALVDEGVVRVGHTRFGSPDALLNLPDRLPVQALDERQGLRWHLAIEAVQSRERSGRPDGSSDRPWLRVGTTRNLMADRMLRLRRVQPSPCLTWVDPQRPPAARPHAEASCEPVARLEGRADIKGKTVLVGVHAPEDQVVIGGEELPGVRAIAAAIEVISQSASPRPLPTAARRAVALLSAGISGALASLLRRWRSGPVSVALPTAGLLLASTLPIAGGLLMDVVALGPGILLGALAGVALSGIPLSGRTSAGERSRQP